MGIMYMYEDFIKHDLNVHTCTICNAIQCTGGNFFYLEHVCMCACIRHPSNLQIYLISKLNFSSEIFIWGTLMTNCEPTTVPVICLEGC